jgi:hypothetical protein
VRESLTFSALLRTHCRHTPARQMDVGDHRGTAEHHPTIDRYDVWMKSKVYKEVLKVLNVERELLEEDGDDGDDV